jgi:hypothetical protein
VGVLVIALAISLEIVQTIRQRRVSRRAAAGPLPVPVPALVGAGGPTVAVAPSADLLRLSGGGHPLLTAPARAAVVESAEAGSASRAGNDAARRAGLTRLLPIPWAGVVGAVAFAGVMSMGIAQVLRQRR